MIQLSEILSPRPEPWWALLRQAGVRHVVSFLRGAEQEQRMFAALGLGAVQPDRDEPEPWGLAALRRDKDLFAEEGFSLVAIEDTAPMDNVRLGRSGRDQEIERVITQVRAMGQLEIPVLCYNWMALSSWARTRIDIPTRGGALVTGFTLQESAGLGAIVHPGEVTAEQLWASLEYFLAAVLPEAEAAGVRLALHPDDPPLGTVRAIPRIMSSLSAYRRLLEVSPSRSNAITFCQGNFALMTDDLPAAIREFGTRDAIAFVHFRDVRGSAESFVETFHDDGQTDMATCLRTYQEVGFDGPLRPDHVPTMYGDDNDRPGYSVLGRVFAIGYIRGLEHAVYGHPAAVEGRA
jgi:mannonate dehydratase